jgi:catechol 2,3-dioxygenase-like lactoylglutathione lyase family enzyme
MKRVLVAAFFASVSAIMQAQQRPAITGVAFVRVYASDPTATANFYGKTLGYTSVKDGAITRYPVNDLQWIETTPLPSPAPAARQAAVGFMTRDAAALAEYLQAHGTTLASQVKNGEFSVRDPEGNLIIFVDQKAPVVAAIKKVGVPATAPSRRMIHAGFVVRDAAKENAFFRELLDFRPYWHGGPNDTTTNWISQQVPEGSDWLEYMLNDPPEPSPKQYGSADHMSLGIEKMPDVVTALAKNGCEGPSCSTFKTGRDGKTQLNLFDPDLTRVEYMEFQPAAKPCCSEFTASHPTATESR